MHKLSRAYIANAGYKLAWYDGVLLDFTESATNDPTHTIYSLVNQGGKTTFLSLLFSCIRTGRSEFLQTLSNPGQRFEDYFDKDGLPGTIAIEWRMPGDLVSPTRTIVTGQIVVVRRASEPVETERWFFLIQGASPLALDDIPAPNLRCQPNEVFRSRDDVVAWLHKMRTDLGEQVFYFTQNQAEWAKSLVSVGLDVELLKHQVDFNRKEGSMDEAFLSFKDEREFVRRFLILTMDASRADQVRETVATHCRRITNRKPLQDAMTQIGRFEVGYQPFAIAARAHADAVLAQREMTNQVASAVATLQLRVREQASQKNAQEELAREQSEGAAKAEARRVNALQDGEAYEEEKLARAVRQREQALKEAEDALNHAKRRVRLVDAAEILGEMKSREMELSALTEAIDKANGEVAPLRLEFRQKGALLREGLRRARSDETEAAAKCRVRAADFSKQLGRLVEEEKSVHREKGAAQTVRVKAEASLAQAGVRRAQLEATGSIHKGELADGALERLRARAEELTQATVELDEIANAADSAMATLQGRSTTLAGEKATADAAATRFDEEMERGLKQQEALQSNMALCRAIGAELADPDSEVLGGLLESYIHRAQADTTQAELDYARLDEDAQSIRDTGLAGRDVEVTKVVRALANGGIKNGQAYAQYLAAVFPDGNEARSLLESNPARFLGVAVSTREQLEHVKALAPTLPDLTRPVVVSLVTDKRTAADDDCLVLNPADDSLFNIRAAAQKGEHIEQKLVEYGNNRSVARQALTNAQDARKALGEYLTTFGCAKLEALGADVRKQRSLAEQATDALSAIVVQIDEERARARQARDSAKLRRGELSTVAHQIQEVSDFRANYDSHSASWQAVAEAQAAEEQRLSTLLEGLLSTKLEFDKRVLDASIAASEHDLRAQRLYEALAELLDADKEFDAEHALNAEPRKLTELQTLYKTAQETLEAAERKQTAPLLARKQAVEQALTMAKGRYAEMGAGLPVTEVSELLNVDFRTERARATQNVEIADASKSRCLTERGAASGRHQDFRKNRAFASHNVPDVVGLSDGSLDTRLANARNDARDAIDGVKQAKAAIQQAQQQARVFGGYAENFSNAMKPLLGLVPEGHVAEPVGNAFITATVAGDEAARLIDGHRTVSNKAQQEWKKCQRLFENVRAIAMSDEFARSDLELAEVLRRNTLEEALEDFERIENGIAQRKASINDELAKMDEDFERAVKELTQLVGEALALLRRATETLKLPDHVPRVAGRTILTMHKGIFGLSQEARRERLGPLMNQLAADGNIPESGAALATYALMELANNKLGLKLLKVVEMVDEQYVPVERLSKSGAESISMAILLYFVIARLRYEQKAQSRSADGGVLILDNPFSKATARPVWEIIIGLANAMNLQLVIATGMQEYETLSVFKRFLRLAKTHQNSATGRIHVGMADFNFKPEAKVA
ncbi:hypothetical protein ACU4GI_14500 [Cupriavidus basilensis]